jgi:hypothetical protein
VKRAAHVPPIRVTWFRHATAKWCGHATAKVQLLQLHRWHTQQPRLWHIRFCSGTGIGLVTATAGLEWGWSPPQRDWSGAGHRHSGTGVGLVTATAGLEWGWSPPQRNWSGAGHRQGGRGAAGAAFSCKLRACRTGVDVNDLEGGGRCAGSSVSRVCESVLWGVKHLHAGSVIWTADQVAGQAGATDRATDRAAGRACRSSLELTRWVGGGGGSLGRVAARGMAAATRHM